MLNRLRRLINGDQSNGGVAATPAPALPRVILPPQPSRLPPAQNSRPDQAEDYLHRVQGKIARLAEEFAAGQINRAQFQQLYEHYQRERRTIETWLETAPETDDWKRAMTEGKSIIIRKRHMARVLGYAIYENESGMPVKTIGQFELDAAIVVPMLSAYRSATREIFGAGLRSTVIEGGRWLVFVPGQVTTLMALYTTEPASNQLENLDELHRLFETANRRHLHIKPVLSNVLVFPHVFFLGRA
jgi:hypothetical protein